MANRPTRILLRPGPCLLALCACLGPGALPGLAQQPEEPLVRRGVLRLEVVPEYAWWDTRFGLRTEDGRQVDEVEPLAFDLARDDVGTAMAPSLAPFELQLAELLQDDGYRLDLGKTRATWSYSRTRIPIRLDLGITDWLTIGGMVPFVRTDPWVSVTLQGDSTTANAGVNPDLYDPDSVDDFLTALSADVEAFTATTASICSDQGPESPECMEAQALLAEGQSLDRGLGTLYLNPASFVPMDGTDAGRTLSARVDRFAAGLDSLGQTPTVGDVPLATRGLADDEFQGLVTGPSYGVSAAPLVPFQGLWQMGDVEVSVAARLLQTPGLTQGTAHPSGFRYLLGVRALYRLGTATFDDPDVLHDLPSGGGQDDLEVTVFGGAYLGARWGLWGHFRYGVGGETQLVRRVAAPDVVLAPAASRATVAWTRGNVSELYLAPRFNLAEAISLTFPYRFLHKAADSYTLPGGATGSPPGSPPGTPDVTVLNQETEVRLHRLGVGLVYSTLPGYRRGRSSIPVELRALYQTSLAGGGGQTPAVNSFQVTFRLFFSLWGPGI